MPQDPEPSQSGNDSIQENRNRKSSRELETILTWAISTLGVITLIAIICFWFFFDKKKIAFAIGNYLMISSALFAGGCILGFLFGIPKLLRQTTSKSTSSFSDNVNLEEISDWLTKIIVGLTLVQFNQIKTMLNEAANNINTAFATEGFNFYALGYAVIIFYMTVGFLISYFWTRTNYVYILAKGRKEVDEIGALEAKIGTLEKQNEEKDKDIKEVKQEKSKLEEKTEKLKDAVQREGNMRLVNENPLVDTVLTDGETAESLKLKSIVEKMLQERKPTDSGHSQKGRWGGESEKNFRKMEFKVTVNNDYNDFYNVKIIVKSVDPAAHPLNKTVVILLDRLFDSKVLYLKPKDNQAEITLVAYEAFTVGAICDDGETLLELDLNNLPGNPSGFNYPVE